MLEGVEDIPGTALAEGLPWDWESFPEYLDALDRRQYTVDIGTHVVHAPLRAYVMGERGADPNEAPTADELLTMADAVRDGVGPAPSASRPAAPSPTAPATARRSARATRPRTS